MDKFKWQYIALVVAIILGGIIGGTIISAIKDKQIKALQEQYVIQLDKEIKAAEDRVVARTDSIAKIEAKQKELELKVQKAYVDILQDSFKTQKKRQDAKQLTSDEKAKWIISRYLTPNK